jgi:hypothetical protein
MGKVVSSFEAFGWCAGNYVKEYCERTGPDFVVGEYWDSLSYEHGVAAYCQNHHRQQIINWLNAAGGQATAFDVTTKGILYALSFHSSLCSSSSSSGSSSS